jgi:L-rhamnose mutarotase
MQRVAFVFKVKVSKIDEYKSHHQAVWPEMQDALRRNGWHNYSLFMRPDGLIFGYFETSGTFQDALDGMDGEPINEKWQEFMAPYVESENNDHPDKTMVELVEVFHLD